MSDISPTLPENIETTEITSDYTEQLVTVNQYLSNNQELLKELIFWEKSNSFLLVMLVVIMAFSVFSNYLKGLSKK